MQEELESQFKSEISHIMLTFKNEEIESKFLRYKYYEKIDT